MKDILALECSDAMKKAVLPSALLLLVLLGVALTGAQAQSTPAPDALFNTIRSLDTQLFDAYNHCDLTTLSSMVSDDLEFYHDKTGLARGRSTFVDAIKNNICGKVTRELVPGTLEVYPIANYGAVEIGVHRFLHPGHDDEVGEAKFITLWQNKDGAWKITRAISYDHHPLTK
jgi:ketosteroid isomerase-like protein